jgi:hypothetical protein
MGDSAIATNIDRNLNHLFRSHQIRMSAPRGRMLKLESVPVGANFSKPRTHVLLRGSPNDHWHVFVDEDLLYRGDNRDKRALFAGGCRRGWRQLDLGPPLRGGVNHAIVWTLQTLESQLVFGLSLHLSEKPGPSGPPPDGAVNLPSTDVGNMPGEGRQNETDPLAGLLGQLVEELPIASLVPPDVAPTPGQLDAVRRAAAVMLLRPPTPRGVCLTGPSGVGKSQVARCAAADLASAGRVDRVVQVHGSKIAAGAMFGPERDERLEQILMGLLPVRNCLVVLEQFDLALLRSDVAATLLAEALDRGLKVIAVARPEFQFAPIRSSAMLRRRLEMVPLRPADLHDTASIVQRRLNQHVKEVPLDIPPKLVELIVELSRRRPGANPAAALGLLEAVLARASLGRAACLGPDDVYHFVSPPGD